MLEGLKHIPWGQLQHAQGPALDIPTLMRLLTSDIKEDREYAFYAFYGNIWHQGVVYQATPFTVPFFLALLSNPETEDKDEIALLLAHIATGASPFENELPPYDEFPGLTLVEEQQDKEKAREWVRSARTAVAEGIDLYLQLIASAPTELCLATSYICSKYPEHSERIVPVLYKRLAHTQDNKIKTGLLLSLRELAQSSPSAMATYATYLNDHNQLVRWAAATCLTQLTEHEPPKEAVSTLLHTIAHPDNISNTYLSLPWANGDIIGDTSLFLCNLDPKIVEFAIPALVEALHLIAPYSALNIAYALLSIAFGEEEDGRELETLNKRQKCVLTAILQSQNLWTINGNMFEILETFGFPGWRDELHDFLKQRHACNIIELDQMRKHAPPTFLTPFKATA